MTPFWKIKPAIQIGIPLIAFIFILGGTAFAGTDCNVISKHLNGDYEKMQSRGGLWGYFERSLALKKKSMIGMQADGKLRRTITIFETLCEENKSKATEALANEIADHLDKALAINNKNPERTHPMKLLKEVEALNKDLDTFIARLEK